MVIAFAVVLGKKERKKELLFMEPNKVSGNISYSH